MLSHGLLALNNVRNASIFGYFIFSFYFIKNYGKGKKGLLSTKIDYFISYESLFSHKEEPDADLLDKGIVP